MEHIKGPDFPTGALIVGRDAIQDAYLTGRGAIRMRAVVEVEEDSRGRQTLVVTELPYQVNRDALAEKIAELVKDGKVGGIADVRDESSGRTGQRLVIVLKRDAVARVVLNNLYKHTQPHAVTRRVHLALRRAPDRRHPAAHPLPVAQGRGARAHLARPAPCDRPHRRGHRPHPGERQRG
jgi:DNA gyrase/topoisomerase IV subunit A